MSVHFTEADMVRLVKIYKEYDCLWDMKHESYRDNEARQTAYKEIVEKLNIPNLQSKDIPNKIKNLRSSYYQEIKKVRRSIRAGGSVYRPRVSWFSTVDGFLRAFRHEREFISKKPENGTKIVNRIFKSSKEDNDKIQREDKQTDQIANEIKSPNNKIEDEFDTFGKYIATCLRSMPQECSIIAKTELQKTLSDIQLKIIRQLNARNYHLTTQSPSGSASTWSDNENQRTECLSPASDSCVSTIKIEYENQLYEH